MPWPAFLIDTHEHYVRFVVICPPGHYVVVERLAGVNFFDDDRPDEPSMGWPTLCPVCRYPMVYGSEDHEASKFPMGSQSWIRRETGEVHDNPEDFGIGAMFDADWLPWKGQDGLSLSIVLPPGGQSDIWHIDGPAGGTDRRPWTRTGTPPNVTASPSIKTDRYHGHLQGGVLTGSLPDRPLD